MNKEAITLRGRTYQPEVLVQPEVYDVLGEPEVDFDGLEELFYKDLGVAIKHEVVIDLYEDHDDSRWGYVEHARPHIAHVRPIPTLKQDAFIHTLIHEGQHVADFLPGLWYVRAWNKLRTGVYAYSDFISKYVSESYGQKEKDNFEKIDFTQKRANVAADYYTYYHKYDNVIKFNKLDEDALYIFGPNHSWQIKQINKY